MRTTIGRGWRAALVTGVALTLAGAGLVAPGTATATTTTATTGSATGYCSIPGLDTYRWTNGTGNGKWQTPGNWNHVSGNDGTAPGLYTPPPYDAYACIPAGATVSFDIGDEAHVAALDLGANASLLIDEGSKLYLHGGPSHVASTTRSGSRLTFRGSTLGGEATLLVNGQTSWTSIPNAYATWTTRLCDGTQTCSGPAPDPGRTIIGAGGTLLVGGLGVNFKDSRVLENRGLVVLSGDAYLAADHGTGIVNSGTFRVANDKGVYEGFDLYGQPFSTFMNSGLLRKTAAGTSVFASPVTTTATGKVLVDQGFLSLFTADGSSALVKAQVEQGATFGTGTCVQGSLCTAPVPTADDTQTTAVTLPQLAGGPVTVSLQELPGAKTAAMLTAPVHIATPNAAATPANPLTFRFGIFNALLPAGVNRRQLAGTVPVSRSGDGDTAYTKVPDCTSAGLSAAVPSCVDRTASRAASPNATTGSVVLIVRTLQNSRWVAIKVK